MTDILNYTYIFLESIFWGYAFFILVLLLLFFGIKNTSVHNEVMNWLAALNVSFVLAMIASLINHVCSWVLFDSRRGGDAVHGNKFLLLTGKVIVIIQIVLAILFLFKKFRTQWLLSLIAIFLIKWDKIYYLIEGTYDEWVAYRPNMPGRSWYPFLFFIAIFFSYGFLFFLRQLPYRPLLVKREA